MASNQETPPANPESFQPRPRRVTFRTSSGPPSIDTRMLQDVQQNEDEEPPSRMASSATRRSTLSTVPEPGLSLEERQAIWEREFNAAGGVDIDASPIEPLEIKLPSRRRRLSSLQVVKESLEPPTTSRGRKNRRSSSESANEHDPAREQGGAKQRQHLYPVNEMKVDGASIEPESKERSPVGREGRRRFSWEMSEDSQSSGSQLAPDNVQQIPDAPVNFGTFDGAQEPIPSYDEYMTQFKIEDQRSWQTVSNASVNSPKSSSRDKPEHLVSMPKSSEKDEPEQLESMTPSDWRPPSPFLVDYQGKRKALPSTTTQRSDGTTNSAQMREAKRRSIIDAQDKPGESSAQGAARPRRGRQLTYDSNSSRERRNVRVKVRRGQKGHSPNIAEHVEPEVNVRTVLPESSKPDAQPDLNIEDYPEKIEPGSDEEVSQSAGKSYSKSNPPDNGRWQGKENDKIKVDDCQNDDDDEIRQAPLPAITVTPPTLRSRRNRTRAPNIASNSQGYANASTPKPHYHNRRNRAVQLKKPPGDATQAERMKQTDNRRKDRRSKRKSSAQSEKSDLPPFTIWVGPVSRSWIQIFDKQYKRGEGWDQIRPPTPSSEEHVQGSWSKNGLRTIFQDRPEWAPPNLLELPQVARANVFNYLVATYPSDMHIWINRTLNTAKQQTYRQDYNIVTAADGNLPADFELMRALTETIGSERTWILHTENLHCDDCIESFAKQREKSLPERLCIRSKAMFTKHHHCCGSHYHIHCRHESRIKRFFHEFGKDDAKRINYIRLVTDIHREDRTINADSLASAVCIVKKHLPDIRGAQVSLHPNSEPHKDRLLHKRVVCALVSLERALPWNVRLDILGLENHTVLASLWDESKRKWYVKEGRMHKKVRRLRSSVCLSSGGCCTDSR